MRSPKRSVQVQAQMDPARRRTPRFENSVLLCVLKRSGLLFAMTSATHREESKFNWPWRSTLVWKDGLVVKVANWGRVHVRWSLACVHATVFYCVHPSCAACVHVSLCVCVWLFPLFICLSVSLSLSPCVFHCVFESVCLWLRVHVGSTSFTKAHPCCCWHVTCGTA